MLPFTPHSLHLTFSYFNSPCVYIFAPLSLSLSLSLSLQIFAQYGFLPQDCATIFCKAMQLEKPIRELGYEFNELLFQTETGEIAPKVS